MKKRALLNILVIFVAAGMSFSNGCFTDKAFERASTESRDQLASYYQSWKTSEHLDHKHALNNITCVDCHGEFVPAGNLPIVKCLECHASYEQIAEKAPIHHMMINPHFGEGETECNSCHKAHQKSVLLCNECHAFDIKVP